MAHLSSTGRSKNDLLRPQKGLALLCCLSAYTPILPVRKMRMKSSQNPNFATPTILILILLALSSSTPLSSSSSSSSSSSASSHPKPPPLPILPIPTSRQLSWQLDEMAMFLHFGPNTFTDSEWGSGRAHPSVFSPTSLNSSQWVQVAKDSGFSHLILTVKHHDGFCLWPSSYTDYSVRSSPWKGGTGDVLAELADAAREAGIGLGLYLSPWDRHEECYGDTLQYNEYYLGQMTELLTRYGVIKYVFLDGAKGAREKDMNYFFDSWFSLIHQLQPEAAIFSDSGPDTRWVGDEDGIAGSSCWSVFNRSSVKIGDPDTDLQYLRRGDPSGHDWVPAECDVSIRPGWFWHASESPKSANTLLEIYYNSLGRNCHLLLNVPPNTSGLISEEDILVLQEFNKLRNTIFSNNLAENGFPSASSTRGPQFSCWNVLEEGLHTYWAPEENQSDWAIYLDFQELVSFNVLQVQEPIQMGQRVIEFHLDILDEKRKWKTVAVGTTVGYKRLIRFPSVETRGLKLVVDRSRADPLISYLGIHMDPFSILSSIPGTNLSSQPYINGSSQAHLNASHTSGNATQSIWKITANHSQVSAI